MKPYQLKSSEFEIFITTLNEQPEHTVSIHQLRNNLANAYVIGEPDNFKAAVVQWDIFPDYPIAFGEDADAIWQMLSTLDKWERIQTSSTVAPALRSIMQDKMQKPIEQSVFIYYMLQSEVPLAFNDDEVIIRILTPDDKAIVDATPSDDRPMVLNTIEATLQREKVAGAIVENQLIGFSESRAADKHVELGVYVDGAWRKRGIASAMANLLIHHFKPQGYKIIWATDEDNIASRRVAAKLGFAEHSRRAFLIPQEEV